MQELKNCARNQETFAALQSFPAVYFASICLQINQEPSGKQSYLPSYFHI